MAPPAAGRPSASAAPEPPQREAAKRRRAPGCAGAGARILSLGVRGAVMAAAVVLFLLFAAAAVILMLALLVAARAFRQQGRRRHRALPDSSAPPPPPAVGLPSAKIRLLPCFEPSPCDGDPSSPRICPVCLDAARAGERWRALPACGHGFHAACVDRWLLLSPGCPVCRATVSVPVS